MKRFLIVLLFLILPFFSHPIFITAQSVTPSSSTDSTISTPSADASSGESLWSKFWSWLTTIFIRTDYTISQRPLKDVTSDMTNYGTVSDSDKHSSSATRLTDSQSQKCYKGAVIRKVILGTSGYPDTTISHICLDSSGQYSVSTDSSCQAIKISDLAHYFIQTNQPFYCDDKNKIINLETDVINKVNETFTESIPSAQLNYYLAIYNDFYLVPKETSDENEENSRNIVKTPLPAGEQNSGSSVSDNKDQLEKSVSPQGTGSGLDGLRPASWPHNTSSNSTYTAEISDTGLTAEDIQNATCSVANKVILTSQCSSINSNTSMKANGSCPSKTLCSSGCGPVSVSEILQAKSETLTPAHLMSDPSSPYYNTYTCDSGTSWTTAVAAFKKYLGENSVGNVLYNCDVADVKNMLCQNNAVMILLNWSTGGHYVVAVGINSDGQLIIKDPGNGQINLYPSNSYYSAKNKTISSCLGVDANYIK